MNFIVFTLAIAACLWTYVHISTWFPGRIRDGADTILFLLAMTLSFLPLSRFIGHFTVVERLGAAFLADVMISLRGLLDVLFDVCKVKALTGQQRHRRQ